MEISATLQDQFADAIDTAVTTTGFARFYTTAYGTLLASCPMNSPAFGPSSTGLITMTTTSAVEDTSPASAGVAALLGLYPTTAATSGAFIVSMGVHASTKEIVMANTTIATTDTVQITSLTIQVPTGTPS